MDTEVVVDTVVEKGVKTKLIFSKLKKSMISRSLREIIYETHTHMHTHIHIYMLPKWI